MRSFLFLKAAAIGTAIMAVMATAGVSAATLIERNETADPGGKTIAEAVRINQANATPSQQQTLSDGIVTWDEHESAIQSVANCSVAAGLRLHVQAAEGMHPTTLGVVAATREGAYAALATLNDCKKEHIAQIEDLWLTQQRPNAAKLEEGTRWLASCVANLGVDIDPQSATNEQLVRLYTSSVEGDEGAVAKCTAQRQIALGF